MIFVYVSVYVIISFFFVSEGLLRKGNDAQTLKRTEFDRGSTSRIQFSLFTSFLLFIITPFLNNFEIGVIKTNISVNIFGILLMIIAMIIRLVAVTTLGRLFTRTLRKTENHTIVSEGIYNYIRHPGYLGDTLLFLGASISVGNIITIIIVQILMLSSYLYRIIVEEKMMIELFGEEYRDYMKRTKRLIPFIY